MQRTQILFLFWLTYCAAMTGLALSALHLQAPF